MATFCVHCHNKIQAQWAFCAFCGADNRPPEHRPPVAAHQHDFRVGNFCVLCGESYNEEGKNPPRRGLVYKNYNLAVGVVFAAIAVGFLGTVLATRERVPIISAISLCVAGALIVLSFFASSSLMVDFDKAEVRTVSGFRPHLRVTRYAFTDIANVSVTCRTSQSRNSNRYYYPVELVVRTGQTLSIREFYDPAEAMFTAQQLAGFLNVPCQNLLNAGYY